MIVERSMQIKQLLQDDDAVSPVIGVILMVAITVILAAVIAAFVLGLGDSDEVGPSVSFNYNYDSGDEQLTITVQSGDSFTASQVSFQGTGLGDSEGTEWHDQATNSAGPDSTVRSGERAQLGDGTAGTSDSVTSNFELDIVWTSQDGDDSNIISRRSGPDA